MSGSVRWVSSVRAKGCAQRHHAPQMPKYGCNPKPTPSAPVKVDCPDGYSCCSQAGPFFQPIDNLTSYCGDTSAGELCCGTGTPCSKNQRCCDSGPDDIAQLAPPGEHETLGLQISLGRMCVDVTAPPPPAPPLDPDLPSPAWKGPGSCCKDPTYGNLSYVCSSGACCGTDPSTAMGSGVNDCIDPATEQCCSGKHDPVTPCPKCGYGCPKQQVCGKDLGACHMSRVCNSTLTSICGWAQNLFPSPERCFECIGQNAARFTGVCYNGTLAGHGMDDFASFCASRLENITTV